MKQLLNILLTPKILSNKREPALAKCFYHLIASNDFYSIFQLYRHIGQTPRQELLEVIAENSHFHTFIDYLIDRPENHLSHLFLAMIHAEKVTSVPRITNNKTKIVNESVIWSITHNPPTNCLLKHYLTLNRMY